LPRDRTGTGIVISYVGTIIVCTFQLVFTHIISLLIHHAQIVYCSVIAFGSRTFLLLHIQTHLSHPSNHQSKQILRMEEKILKTLNYNVTVPTPHTFLIRFLKAAHADKLMAQLACFLLDGTLLSLETLTCNWRPSQLAAAAILLARRQLGRHNWSPTLVAYSRYREEDVMPVARAVLQNKLKLEENRELMALAKKYSKTKYGKVSHTAFLPLESSVSDETSSSSRTSEAGDDSIAQSEL
jgi:hypothetical protein